MKNTTPLPSGMLAERVWPLRLLSRRHLELRWRLAPLPRKMFLHSLSQPMMTRAKTGLAMQGIAMKAGSPSLSPSPWLTPPGRMCLVSLSASVKGFLQANG